MATDQKMVVLGVGLIAASTAILIASGTLTLDVPLALAAIGTLGLAAGSLLVGVSEGGRAV
ncbi:hypothetical protein [Natronorarus salvus]|uniref:hypothetical protein n=1 Tax=Natronorarus salvus TaxID=3117733 RepID=UPI002F25F767